jgi:predicted acyltransferase
MNAKPIRFTALDVFRGLTICLMIIVNTPGDGAHTFAPLQHASWHGFTPTDLVFPSFLFAVGNALSFVQQKWNSLPEAQVIWKITKRTLLIFLLGYLMYWFPFVKRNEAQEWVLAPFADTRVFGVLQRIALCYGIASLMIRYLKPRASLYLSIFFLLFYWFVLYAFGGNDPLGMQGNIGYKIDAWLLGDAHLYHGEGMAFDPEGLLSTLPAIANVVAGFHVGKYLQEKGMTYESLAKLLLTGALLLFLAWCWNLSFPINKKLWTSSFVLHTVGLDCILLAMIIYTIEFRKQTRWTYFFLVFGRNPLFIYLLSELGVTLLYVFRTGDQSLYPFVYEKVFSHAGHYWGSLLFAVSYMLCCWLVGYVLDKRKIYIKV